MTTVETFIFENQLQAEIKRIVQLNKFTDRELAQKYMERSLTYIENVVRRKIK